MGRPDLEVLLMGCETLSFRSTPGASELGCFQSSQLSCHLGSEVGGCLSKPCPPNPHLPEPEGGPGTWTARSAGSPCWPGAVTARPLAAGPVVGRCGGPHLPIPRRGCRSPPGGLRVEPTGSSSAPPGSFEPFFPRGDPVPLLSRGFCPA